MIPCICLSIYLHTYLSIYGVASSNLQTALYNDDDDDDDERRQKRQHCCVRAGCSMSRMYVR